MRRVTDPLRPSSRLRHTGGLVLLIPLLLSPATEAQPPQPSEQLAAIDRLAPMLGGWEGAGWIQMGPEQRSEFRQTESIREAAGGTTVLVEGRGTADAGGREIVVHDALAVVSFDPETKKYTFSSYTGRGEHHESDLTLGDDGTIVWGLDTPRGVVRFTITIADGKWHEVGEASPDGETWYKFLEMNLTRR